MRTSIVLILIALVTISCDQFFGPENNTRYIMEVNTREYIITLAADRSTEPYFKEIISITDSLKSKKDNSRYSDLFFQTLKSSTKISAKDIFLNSKNASGLASGASEDEIIKFVESGIVKATDRIIETIKRRLKYTLSKKSVVEKIAGSDRIMVMVYTEDSQRTKNYLTAFGKIEFLYVYDMEKLAGAFSEANKSLSKTIQVEATEDLLVDGEKPEKSSEVLQSPFVTLMDSRSWSGGLYYNTKDTTTIGNLIRQPGIRKFFPGSIFFIWTLPSSDGKAIELLPIERPHGPYIAITGASITKATSALEASGQYAIEFTLDSIATIKWKRMTRFASEANPQKRIAILLDNYCISAPVVVMEIPNGNSSISGNFTMDETNDIAALMNGGMYPLSIKQVHEETIKK